MLDERLRVGSVKTLREGRLRSVERASVPQADPVEKLSIAGSGAGDLISSIDRSLDADVGAAQADALLEADIVEMEN